MFNQKKEKMPGTEDLNLASYGLMSDGLPNIGKKMVQGDAEMAVYDRTLKSQSSQNSKTMKARELRTSDS